MTGSNPIQIVRTYRATNASGLTQLCIQTITVRPAVGDLNADCAVDRADLDLLMAQIRAHSTDGLCDVNGDGKVDVADARWLAPQWHAEWHGPNRLVLFRVISPSAVKLCRRLNRELDRTAGRLRLP